MPDRDESTPAAPIPADPLGPHITRAGTGPRTARLRHTHRDVQPCHSRHPSHLSHAPPRASVNPKRHYLHTITCRQTAEPRRCDIAVVRCTTM